MLSDTIFKNKIPDFAKLQACGFVLDDNKYTYSCPIIGGQFRLNVDVSMDGTVQTAVFDTDTNEEYVLHLVASAQGSFVGNLREEYVNILKRIAAQCFTNGVFKSDYARAVIDYVRQKYQEEFEFLWDKFLDNAIVRCYDNKKWYAAILTAAKNKFGLSGTEKTEILDVRMLPEKIEQSVDGKKYFGGYHMNKHHWVTVRLDGSVPLPEIFELIDNSRCLAKK